MARKKPQTGISGAVAKDRPKQQPAKAAGGPIYQLKITLNNVQPPIWRRVQVKDCTLDRLHAIIQDSMGWSDDHLHVFEIGPEQFGAPEQWEEGDEDVSSSRKVKLSRLVGQGLKKFRYTYDMGDNWDHTIQIEKTLEPEPGVAYPRCIAGERACPPEDCGGAWGYGDFLKTISDPKHPEHEEMVEWVGGEFDPEAFDMQEINGVLGRLR